MFLSTWFINPAERPGQYSSWLAAGNNNPMGRTALQFISAVRIDSGWARIWLVTIEYLSFKVDWF